MLLWDDLRNTQLTEQLEPLLSQLKEISELSQKYQVAKEWFLKHPENLAVNMLDLHFLCTLPDELRYIVSYPVMGNYFAEYISNYDPQNTHEKEAIRLGKELILETRFNNSHWDKKGKDYESHLKYNELEDAFTTHLLSDEDQSIPILMLYRTFFKLHRWITRANPQFTIADLGAYQTDPGHGLGGPILHLLFTIDNFEYTINCSNESSTNYSTIIIDDDVPEFWKERFEKNRFTTGALTTFTDCESALAYISKNPTEVIVTDMDLGRGKMNGLEFALQAREIQESQGIFPQIALFSSSDEWLRFAKTELENVGKLDSGHIIGYKKISFKVGELLRDIRLNEVCRRKNPESQYSYNIKGIYN